MKKPLLFGSMLALFVVMMLPMVPAAEAKAVQSYQRDISLKALEEKYANDPSPQLFFFLKFFVRLLKLIISIPLIVLYIYLWLILLP